MFFDEQLTTWRVAWALILIVLVLSTPVSIDFFFHPGKRFAQLAETQEAHATAAPTPDKTAAKPSAPESIAKNLVRAWNQGDSEAVVRMFLPDGILIMPTGSVIRSRSAIRKRLLEERKGRLKESVLSNTVDDVSLVDANTALVKGQYVLDGLMVMGIKTSPAGSYVLRQKRQQGAWMIEKAEVLGKTETPEKAKS